MLTGDKNETAKCIAIAAGLKDRRQTIFEIKDITSVNDVMALLGDLEKA